MTTLGFRHNLPATRVDAPSVALQDFLAQSHRAQRRRQRGATRRVLPALGLVLAVLLSGLLWGLPISVYLYLF